MYSWETCYEDESDENDSYPNRINDKLENGLFLNKSLL